MLQKYISYNEARRHTWLSEIIRAIHNWLFVFLAKRHGITCAGSQLDAQQVESVVACEDAQLVLASAGSGKTMSLLAKIEYIHRELGIPAEQILAISFTKKTVLELIERCAVENVNICTFHGLGNSIVKMSASPELGARELIDDAVIADFIRRKIAEFCRDEKFWRMLNDYILFYYSAPASPGEFVDFAARISFNRLYLRRALKSVESKEFIRSKEEQLIANWLRIHQLEYRHQIQYPFTEARYRPSFTVGDIYIDLLQINRDGSSPQGKEYLHELKWRRKIHQKYQTKYIELYSYQWNDDTLFSSLQQKLLDFGASPRRLPEQEISAIIHGDQTYINDEHDLFAKLQTFLSLHKNAQYSNQEVVKRVMSRGDSYAKKRADLFLRIYFRIKLAYEQFLEENRQYDFADMINLAARIVREVPECARSYRYILLDEVQDLSRNRFLLVREILRKNPGCKLFAVGDDWQSIYRFTGSDLTLIQEFEKTFGLKTRRSFIETTHRFGQPTINISCGFIQKNPAQSHKNVSNKKTKPTPIKVILNATSVRDNDAESLSIILTELIKTRGYDELKHKELQIISRYNHDIKRIQGVDNIKVKIDKAAGTAKAIWHNPRDSSQVLNLEYCSMHKSKGITRDIVIVLNMNADLMGMPATREADPIFDALLAKEDNFAFAEERRLFYVAITRAREETYLIANRKNPSPFIFEISEEIKTAYGKLCPKCETGELIRKHGKHGDFYYCSNYRYGCNYLKK